jgi:glutathione synthase/RimK-type ligase-like ATP-grasp enzyme
MKAGQYIVDRFLPEFVAAAAESRGIRPEVMSDGWVIRLDDDAVRRWVVGYQFDLNTTATSAVAQDKVATYLALTRAGVAAVPHALVRSVPHEPDIATHLLGKFNGPLVIKPLDGTGGRGVHKVSDAGAAVAVVQGSEEVAWAASPWYDVAAEYRVIVLDGQVLLAYEKTGAVELHGLRFYNLGLGAVAQDIASAQRLAEVSSIALETCRQLGLRLAAVDIVQAIDNGLLVLEVNDGIMMENYARQSAEYKARAARIYDAIVAAMFA